MKKQDFSILTLTVFFFFLEQLFNWRRKRSFCLLFIPFSSLSIIVSLIQSPTFLLGFTIYSFSPIVISHRLLYRFVSSRRVFVFTKSLRLHLSSVTRFSLHTKTRTGFIFLSLGTCFLTAAADILATWEFFPRRQDYRYYRVLILPTLQSDLAWPLIQRVQSVVLLDPI